MSTPRKMPTARAVHKWWAFHEWDYWWRTWGQVDVGEPSCYRCSWWNGERDDNPFSGLDRAHLTDRWCDGDDSHHNLVLLCRECHREMPSFQPGEYFDAVAWVATGRHFLLERCIDKLGSDAWDALAAQPPDPDVAAFVVGR